MKILNLCLLIVVSLFVSACNPNLQGEMNNASQNKDSGQTSDLLHERSSIIGGELTPREHLVNASTVAIMARGYREHLRLLCSGTLISNNLVITAAHCFLNLPEKTTLHVYFGIILPRMPMENVRSVEAFEMHPGFSPIYENKIIVSSRHDIALLKFKGVLPHFSKPAKVLSTLESLKEQDQLLVAGYGLKNDEYQMNSEGLRHTSVKIHSFWESHLILNQTDKNGTCLGDSGGPAYLQTPQELYLVGATRGAHKGSTNCRGYSEVTSVPESIDFIIETSQKLSDSLPEIISL